MPSLVTDVNSWRGGEREGNTGKFTSIYISIADRLHTGVSKLVGISLLYY